MAEEELVVRPCLPGDLLQVAQIMNFWIMKGPYLLIEPVLSAVDVVEMFRDVKARGLPFLVACPANLHSDIYGLAYADPEFNRPFRLPGVVEIVVCVHPDRRGRYIVDYLMMSSIRSLLSFPDFKGSIIEMNAANAQVQRKLTRAFKSRQQSVLMREVMEHRGVWQSLVLEYLPRGSMQAALRELENLYRVKI